MNLPVNSVSFLNHLPNLFLRLKFGTLVFFIIAASFAAANGAESVASKLLNPGNHGLFKYKSSNIIYSFPGSGDYGSKPLAGLTSDDEGALYGTTSEGGKYNNGVVFRLKPPLRLPCQFCRPPQWTLTLVYSFKGGSVNSGDGASPYAGLVFRNGEIYGTTSQGGTGCLASDGCGTVFKLTPPAGGEGEWTETVQYNFQGGSDGGNPLNGSLIFDQDGALYGTTSVGGMGCITSGCGTVFKLTPPPPGQNGWTETVLYRFGALGAGDGSVPFGGLVFRNGELFGTTIFGGNKGAGTLFKLTPPPPGQNDWKETQLYSFSNVDDGNPMGALILGASGSLYGTAQAGDSSSASPCGNVFKLTPPQRFQTGWTETVLHSFQGGKDGCSPMAGLIADSSGALYGATALGGNGDNGAVYKLTPPVPPRRTWTETILYRFNSSPDGSFPSSALIFDKNGALYGTTQEGGAGSGVIFKIGK